MLKNYILDNLPSIWIVLVFILGLTLAAGNVKAETDWDGNKYQFRWMHVPVVCGTTPEIQRYLDDNDFELVSMSVGREGAIKMALSLTLLHIITIKIRQNLYQQ